MVDVYQVVLGAIAVSIILVPVGVVLLCGLVAGRWNAAISNWRESRRQNAERRRNLRAMRRQQGVPLEQVAANLRRLRGVLTVDAHRSVHQIGNRVAYDQVLIQASEMLQIEHDLAKRSAGMERDIERLRVEAELERAGVVLSDRRYGQAA
jgi:hypothetical protein